MVTKFKFSEVSIKRKRGKGSHSLKGRSYYCPGNDDMSSDPFNISIVINVSLSY